MTHDYTAEKALVPGKLLSQKKLSVSSKSKHSHLVRENAIAAKKTPPEKRVGGGGYSTRRGDVVGRGGDVGRGRAEDSLGRGRGRAEDAAHT